MVDTPAVEEPFSPASGRTDPADKRTWFGHPSQLARLFTTEMWERWGYYGMRVLLTLYLTKHFLFRDEQATGLYGGYTALVYLTPLIGGFLADQYLGSKRAVKFGAIVMAVGYFTLAFGGSPAKPYATIGGQRYEIVVDNFVDRPTSDPREASYLVDHGKKLLIKGNEDGSVSLLDNGHEARHIPKGGLKTGSDRNTFTIGIMLLALSLISVGNGFFKPNISTIVGTLYEKGDRRRDAGFTIFYMGINLGSIGGQVFCPLLADKFGWPAGLSLAGFGMLISWALIQFDGGLLRGYGEVPQRAGPDRAIPIYIGALISVPLILLLFLNVINSPPAEAGAGFWAALMALPLLNKVLYVIFIASVPGILAWAWFSGSRAEFQMMFAAMVLITFNVVFWTLFEQAGSSLTLFADRNTNRTVTPAFFMGHGQLIIAHALMIIVLVALIAWLWSLLVRRRVSPTVWTVSGTSVLTVAGAYLIYLIGTNSNVARVIGPWVISAPQTQNFNPLAIVVLAPLMSWLWTGLAKRGLEPSIPVKFALALAGVGTGFLFLVWGSTFVGPDFQVGLWWLAGLYVIHSIAELMISPVGLSMITKLSIARIVGLMMGVWFLSISIAQSLAGLLAQSASVETVGGQVMNAKISLDTYTSIYWQFGLITVGIGIVLFLLSWPLQKWMHGVK